MIQLKCGNRKKKKLWPTKSKKGKIEQIRDSTNHLQMAEYLNEYFSTIGENLSETL